MQTWNFGTAVLTSAVSWRRSEAQGSPQGLNFCDTCSCGFPGGTISSIQCRWVAVGAQPRHLRSGGWHRGFIEDDVAHGRIRDRRRCAVAARRTAQWRPALFFNGPHDRGCRNYHARVGQRTAGRHSRFLPLSECFWRIPMIDQSFAPEPFELQADAALCFGLQLQSGHEPMTRQAVCGSRRVGRAQAFPQPTSNPFGLA